MNDYNNQITNQRLQKLENLVKYLLTIQHGNGNVAYFITRLQGSSIIKGDVVSADGKIIRNQYLLDGQYQHDVDEINNSESFLEEHNFDGFTSLNVSNSGISIPFYVVMATRHKIDDFWMPIGPDEITRKVIPIQDLFAKSFPVELETPVVNNTIGKIAIQKTYFDNFVENIQISNIEEISGVSSVNGMPYTAYFPEITVTEKDGSVYSMLFVNNSLTVIAINVIVFHNSLSIQQIAFPNENS